MLPRLGTSLPRVPRPPTMIPRRAFSTAWVPRYEASTKIAICFSVGVAAGGGAAVALCEADRLERWENRWATGNVAWHRSEPNAGLVNHYNRFLGPEKNQSPDGEHHRILVPLCGKSVDLLYLADRGNEVVGVEAVEAAAWQLQRDAWLKFQTNQEISTVGASDDRRPDFIAAPTFDKKRRGYVFKTGDKGTGYYLDAKAVKWFRDTRKPLSLVIHDFLHLNPGDIGKFDRLWDRASLVAIRPEDRQEYVATCDSLLKPGGRILLVTLVYDQDKMKGPPFSVPLAEVHRLYGNLGYHIETLSTFDARKDYKGRKWDQLQASGLDEVTFLLTKPAPSKLGWFARAILGQKGAQHE